MIYADHAATTPMDPRVLESMMPYLTDSFFNPSSIYANARKVRNEIEHARGMIAESINAQKEEIVFTSGGTESDNLAIKGFAFNAMPKGRHMITTSIEHHAVLNTFLWLEKQGFSVTYLPCDKNGLISADVLEKNIAHDTSLISIMWVNNETGAIQNIRELAKIARKHGAVFHTDAVQAFGTEEIDIKNSDIDLLTISGHKIYGPKGIGVLYCSKNVVLSPLLHGGQQENLNRAGTEPVASIIGMSKAIELTKQEQKNTIEKLKSLKDRFLQNIAIIDDLLINGNIKFTTPGIVNISIKGVEAEAILIYLSNNGILASIGAACNSNSIEPSHVIKALGIPDDYSRGSLRFSFGKNNTIAEIDFISEKLCKACLMNRKTG